MEGCKWGLFVVVVAGGEQAGETTSSHVSGEQGEQQTCNWQMSGKGGEDGQDKDGNENKVS